jgi:hypothetical protein
MAQVSIVEQEIAMENSCAENPNSTVEDAARPPALTDWPKGAERSEDEDNGSSVFQKLVAADDDVVGLVAYSIYKQNKLDWLRAFEKLRSRAPGEAELSAYIIGENTPRRLATYRHLAESTLAGATVSPNLAGGSKALTYYESTSASAKMNMVSYLMLGVTALIAVFLAARFGVGVK